MGDQAYRVSQAWAAGGEDRTLDGAGRQGRGGRAFDQDPQFDRGGLEQRPELVPALGGGEDVGGVGPDRQGEARGVITALRAAGARRIPADRASAP